MLPPKAIFCLRRVFLVSSISFDYTSCAVICASSLVLACICLFFLPPGAGIATFSNNSDKVIGLPCDVRVKFDLAHKYHCGDSFTPARFKQIMKDHDCTISDWFQVKSGVRQGCILSPILFLVVIDWTMRKTTSDKPRGIQWNLFSHLEDLDFADDLAILSTNCSNLQEKTARLETYAKQTGLHINTAKTQVMYVNATCTPTAPITANGDPLEFVDEFTYLGSLISTEDNGAQKNIKARLGKVLGAFARLQSIWTSKQYSLKTKVRLYNSSVKSVLLCGSECWRAIKSDMSKLESFHNGCLRKICRIFWPNKISNRDLYRKTGCQSVVMEIKRSRIQWLGHVLRMGQARIPKVALHWTPPGKRKPGRPKTTWRRTVMSELSEVKLTWGEAQHAAQNRAKWKEIVVA